MSPGKHAVVPAVSAVSALAAAAAVAVPAALSGTVAPAAPVVREVAAVLDVAVTRQVPAARPLVTRAVSAQKSYTVVSGDTLSRIAGASCGNAGAWPAIWHGNQAEVPDPDVIYPGQVLTLTCRQLAAAVRAPAAPPKDPPAPGKTWGVTYGYPNYCGDGDGDGWDVPCRQAAAAPQVKAAAPSVAVAGVSGGTLSFAGLEALWQAAGGPASAAAAAATVAECESGGQQYAHNPSGASGYWQILGQVVGGNIYDPLVNAENAVSKFQASGGTWAQWVCKP